MPTIRTTYDGDMLFRTHSGSHDLVIDVPAPMGGKDRGMTPPEVFIASLGSCVGALVADYCGRSGLDATGMIVDVDFDKASDPTRLENLKVRILLPHTECGRREDAVRRVAEHCPVHETIATLGDVTFEVLDSTALHPA